MTRLNVHAVDQAARLRAIVRGLDEHAAPDTLDHVEPINRARAAPVVAIASGKGGVGKTTTSVNLSIALQAMGIQTALLDADLGMANADVLCGVTPGARLNASLEGSHAPQLSEIAVRAPGGFLLVPGSVGLGRMGELSPSEQRALVTRLVEVERVSDLVLVDTSAGLGASVRRFVHAADATIVVATPEPTSIADAYTLIKVLLAQDTRSSNRPPRLALVVNQAQNDREVTEVHQRISRVCEQFLHYPLPILGGIVRDKRVLTCVRSRTPILLKSPRSPASKRFRKLAQQLVAWARADFS